MIMAGPGTGGARPDDAGRRGLRLVSTHPTRRGGPASRTYCPVPHVVGAAAFQHGRQEPSHFKSSSLSTSTLHEDSEGTRLHHRVHHRLSSLLHHFGGYQHVETNESTELQVSTI
jgi:hypothetical protein